MKTQYVLVGTVLGAEMVWMWDLFKAGKPGAVLALVIMGVVWGIAVGTLISEDIDEARKRKAEGRTP